MRINFNRLGTFLAVAENASFRKAADQAHISLPAVSMQIKHLEEQVGVALFQRTTRKVELTQEGEQLLISARKAMAEIESGLATIQQSVDIHQGRLSFGCVPTVAGSRLPLILTHFASKFPGITVYVREMAHHDLLEAVRRREVDFGIGPVSDQVRELAFKPLFIDEYCALLPKGYRDRGRAGISLRELAKLPLLTLSSATLFRHHFDKAMVEHGLVPQSNYEFTHVSTLIAMAEAGLGVAVLAGVAVPLKTSLKVVRIINPVVSRTIAIVTIRGHTLSPAAGRLVEMCERLIAPPSAKASLLPKGRRSVLAAQ